MALDILKRLVAYLEPLGFLAIGLYGMHPQPGPFQTLTFTTGAFLVLLEIITFQNRPKDILSPSKFSGRIFGKLWLRIGMSATLGLPSKRS